MVRDVNADLQSLFEEAVILASSTVCCTVIGVLTCGLGFIFGGSCFWCYRVNKFNVRDCPNALVLTPAAGS